MADQLLCSKMVTYTKDKWWKINDKEKEPLCNLI